MRGQEGETMEYERVKEEALLTDEELYKLKRRRTNTNAYDIQRTDVLNLVKDVAQAQLDKVLKYVEIRAKDQVLPKSWVNYSDLFEDKVLSAHYKQAQQDMLKAGFVKVEPKGGKE